MGSAAGPPYLQDGARAGSSGRAQSWDPHLLQAPSRLVLAADYLISCSANLAVAAAAYGLLWGGRAAALSPAVAIAGAVTLMWAVAAQWLRARPTAGALFGERQRWRHAGWPAYLAVRSTRAQPRASTSLLPRGATPARACPVLDPCAPARPPRRPVVRGGALGPCRARLAQRCCRRCGDGVCRAVGRCGCRLRVGTLPACCLLLSLPVTSSCLARRPCSAASGPSPACCPTKVAPPGLPCRAGLGDLSLPALPVSTATECGRAAACGPSSPRGSSGSTHRGQRGEW